MLPISFKSIFGAFANAWDARDRKVGWVVGTGASTSMAPSATGAGSLGVTIAAGSFVYNGGTANTGYAGGAITLDAANATLPRVDIVYMNSSGTLAKTTGTPVAIVVGSSGPVPPAWPSGSCPLAVCLVPPAATDFTGDGYVADMRPFENGTSSPLTTKGDVWTYSTTDARVAVGANGTIFTAASGATTGNAWGQGPLSARGDLMVGAATAPATRLAIGAAGRLLSTDGTDPAWGQGPATTDGDLIVGATAGTPTRLARGASNGMFLSIVSSALAWGQGPLTTLGDLLIGAASAPATRLAIGAAGKFLSSDGTTAAWGQGPLTTTGDMLLGATGGTPTRLAIGASTHVLTSNGTTAAWAAASGGQTWKFGVAQPATTFTTSSATFVDVTGWTVTQTPASATNTIIVSENICCQVSSGATVEIQCLEGAGGIWDDYMTNQGAAVGWVSTRRAVRTNVAAAGTTWKLQAKTSAGTLSIYGSTSTICGDLFVEELS